MDQSEAASIREAVTRRLNDYVEASLSLDAEKCLDCFAGMEEPVMASDGKLLVGWDAHVEFFREGLKALRTADYLIQEYSRVPARAGRCRVLDRV